MKTKTMRIDISAQVLILNDDGEVANEVPIEGKFYESQFALTLGHVAEQAMLQVNYQLSSQGIPVDPVRPVKVPVIAPADLPEEKTDATEPERATDPGPRNEPRRHARR